jgi:FlaA1/EpsC-like NDP-sugar epimerase
MMLNMNRYRSSAGLLFVLIDSLLILTGMVGGVYLRFRDNLNIVLLFDYLIVKVMLVVLVIQIAFYYFGLYELRIFRERIKMGLLFLESLGASAVLLAVVYYFVPLLTIGRGIFALGLTLVFVFTFLWRLLYAIMLKVLVNKEKILIVGTGELAKKVGTEILEKGDESFEIIGFIDENRNNIGNRV